MSLLSRSWRKTGIGAATAFLAFSATQAMALPQAYQLGFQPANSPVMDQIENFHTELLYIITAVCLFVLALLVYIAFKFRSGANPTPSKVHHNTLLEVAWTIIPVIILVVIAVPSFRLLYFESSIPKADVTIKAIGKQWFWTYEYPGANAGFTFDSLGLSDADAAKAKRTAPPGRGQCRGRARQQGGRSRHHRRRRDPFLGAAADGREDGCGPRPPQPHMVQG